jgi:hypothetical protein
MTYKFEQFNVEIVDPIVKVINVNDRIDELTCYVDIELITDTAKFGVTLEGFSYVNDWSDADIRAWVAIELQKYEV